MPPQEFEITLAAPSRTLAAIARAPVLSELVHSAAHRRALETTYWDTPALDLRRCGITLRMRKTDDGWLQSLKTRTDEPFLRHEIEGAATTERPDVAAAARAAQSVGVLWPAVAQELVPLFTSRISRVTWDVEFPDGTRAELAADTGTLTATASPEAKLDVSEIELELKHGELKPLYELAFRLVHELPRARLLFASKADRGYALASGETPRLRRAQSWSIDPGWSSADLLARAAAECLTQVHSNIEGVRSADDPQYLHQMRIGVRRTRTLFQVTRAAHLGEVPPKLREEVKWIWDLLGVSRDWDVFAQTTWQRVASGAKAEQDAIAPFTRAVHAQRVARHAALRRAIDGKRFQKTLLALGWFFAHISAPGARGGVTKLSRRVLKRPDRRVRRAAAHLGRSTDAERHRLRIEAKKLRYLAEFFASLHDKRAARHYLQSLATLQDALGDLNDVAVTQVIAKDAMARLTPSQRRIVQALIDGYVASSSAFLQERLDSAWKAFQRADPFWRKRRK